MASSAAAALQRLDAGAISAMLHDEPSKPPHPVLQCLQVKVAEPQDGQPTRMRIIVSDSKNWTQVLLSTVAVGPILASGRLRRGCLVQLGGYQLNWYKDKRIIIANTVETLEEYGELEKLGNPEPIEVKREDVKDQSNAISSNGFYGQPGQQQQNRSMPSHSRNPQSSAQHANMYPIEALSPYTHKWTIKARCTHKSDIKTWHNRNGEGKLFSVNLLDESGEIRATGFNEQCDQLYELFQEGSVYYISTPCKIQLAKRQFSNINNDSEIVFERETVVEKAAEEVGVPQVRYNFTTLADLQSVDKDTTVDVVGVLKDVGETSQITSKTTSKPYDKRELTIVDDTNYSVRLTIWGKTAASFDVLPDTVVAFKGVKVSDFGGRSLSLLSSGSLTVNPDMEEAHKLKGWYDSIGQTSDYNTHSGITSTVTAVGGGSRDQDKTCAVIEAEESEIVGDRAVYFNLKATIQYIKQENFCYPACLSAGCNKKVVEIDGQWRCEKCNKNHDKPEYRYIMRFNVNDHTGHLWLSCFDETGKLLMGRSADEVMAIQEDDQKRAAEIFSAANCRTWNFKIKAKRDNFQDEERVRYQVISATRLDFTAESDKLAKLIEMYKIN